MRNGMEQLISPEMADLTRLRGQILQSQEQWLARASEIDALAAQVTALGPTVADPIERLSPEGRPTDELALAMEKASEEIRRISALESALKQCEADLQKAENTRILWIIGTTLFVLLLIAYVLS